MEKNRIAFKDIASIIFVLVVFIMSVVFLFVSCCPKVVERVITETKIEYRDRVIHDTTTFEVEKEVENIVTRDTVSHLENRWAKSDALVSEGFLSHSLESIPQIVKVPFEVEVHDTTYVKEEAQIIEKEVKVEKSLSWWQRTKLAIFPWLLLAVTVMTCWICRRPFLSLLKKLLKL